VVDQLTIEKRGIPTVTILTTAFEDLFKSAIMDQGVSDIAMVAVEHPIAGRSLEDTRKMADSAFPNILKAATQWHPTQ
jgi:hypothetical protein